MKSIACVVLCSLFIVARPAWAQDHGKPAGSGDLDQGEPTCVTLDLLSADCAEDFARWQQEEGAWREWMVDHGGQIVYNRFGSKPADRLPRPEIPAWVAARCDLLDQSNVAPDDVCQFYAETLAYDWPDHVEVPASPPLAKVSKRVGEVGDFWTWFRKSLHYNGLWVVPDTRSRAFLVGGVHVAWAQISERMYLFGPGIMLVRMSDGAGNSVFRPAQTWGISIRLKDVNLFQNGNEFSLYFNVANGRIHGGGPQLLGQGQGQGMTVVGFSISARK
jgi:hypothetical protein